MPGAMTCRARNGNQRPLSLIDPRIRSRGARGERRPRLDRRTEHPPCRGRKALEFRRREPTLARTDCENVTRSRSVAGTSSLVARCCEEAGVPAGCSTARRRMNARRVYASTRQDPSNDAVGVPHFARAHFVPTPDRGRNRRHHIQDSVSLWPTCSTVEEDSQPPRGHLVSNLQANVEPRSGRCEGFLPASNQPGRLRRHLVPRRGYREQVSARPRSDPLERRPRAPSGTVDTVPAAAWRQRRPRRSTRSTGRHAPLHRAESRTGPQCRTPRCVHRSMRSPAQDRLTTHEQGTRVRTTARMMPAPARKVGLRELRDRRLAEPERGSASSGCRQSRDDGVEHRLVRHCWHLDVRQVAEQIERRVDRSAGDQGTVRRGDGGRPNARTRSTRSR